MVQRFEDLLGLGDHHCIVQVVFVTVECAVGSSIQVHVHQDLRATLVSHRKRIGSLRKCYSRSMYFSKALACTPPGVGGGVKKVAD